MEEMTVAQAFAQTITFSKDIQTPRLMKLLLFPLAPVPQTQAQRAGAGGLSDSPVLTCSPTVSTRITPALLGAHLALI